MKKLTICIMLLAILAFAGIEGGFTQFTRNDVELIMRGDQAWESAKMMYMHVPANSSVWLTNYISNYKGSVPDLEEIYDMGTDNKFGYILASDFNGNNFLEVSEYEANDITIHYSTSNRTEDITFYSDANPTDRQTTKGYFPGEFAEATDIYLVMTALPSEGGARMDTYQYVDDANGYKYIYKVDENGNYLTDANGKYIPDQWQVQTDENGVSLMHDRTALLSRNYKTNDQLDDVRINLGYKGFADGHEFVAVYAAMPPETSGQPLPGVLLAGLLSVGSIVSCKRLRRRK